MERLKSILADKVLDLSAGSGDEVRIKLDKIQRFRDFANALKSLMIKYPAIEDELITMVEDGDFDTKVASSRVDMVIRLSDSTISQANRQSQLVGNNTESTSEDIIINSSVIEEPHNIINPDDIPMEIYTGEDAVYEQGYDTINSIDDVDIPVIENEKLWEKENSNQVSYSAVPDEIDTAQDDYIETTVDNTVDSDYAISANVESDTVTEDIIKTDRAEPILLDDEDNSYYTEEEKAAKRKVMIRRIVQVTGIVLAVVALIFIVKFVMDYWQTILIVAGVLAVIAILIVWYKRKRS